MRQAGSTFRIEAQNEHDTFYAHAVNQQRKLRGFAGMPEVANNNGFNGPRHTI